MAVQGKRQATPTCGIAIPRGGRAAAAIDGVANGRWRPSLRGRIGARDAYQVVGIMWEESLHLVEVPQGVLDPSGQLVFLARIHLQTGKQDKPSSYALTCSQTSCFSLHEANILKFQPFLRNQQQILFFCN